MIELRDYQQDTIKRMHNGCILYGGVGAGKSITALAYFYQEVCGGDISSLGSVSTPRDLVVITTAKKRDSLDWESDAVKFGISRDRGCSVDGIAISVDSWNNLEKYEDVSDAFFIFDEQRLVGSGSWVKSFLKIAKRNQWILLSATPGDTWLDYIPVFIANGFYPNRTAFKREHVVYSSYTKFPKVERYLGIGTLVRHKNAVLVEMPYRSNATRHDIDVEVSFNKGLLQKVVKDRWHVYENRPLKDVAELFSVSRKVVNTDASRMQMVRQLITTHPRVIVFYNFDYELELLRSLIGAGNQTIELPTQSQNKPVRGYTFVPSNGISQSTPTETSVLTVAEWNGHKHEQIPKTDRWVYLVQYLAGAEGWNCVETDAMIFYSRTYSWKIFEQAHGRIDRMNTPFSDLYYYHLVSKSWIDLAIGKSLRVKKSFNEAKYRQMWAKSA